MSRSFVARGSPYAARAWAPTTRKSTPAADNSRNISAKSGAKRCWLIRPPHHLGQLPGKFDPLAGSHPPRLFVDDRLFAELVFPHRYVPSRHVANYIPRYTRRTHAASSSSLTASPCGGG